MFQQRLAPALLAFVAVIARVEAARGGVVVEWVKKGSSVEKAGLRAGDGLLAWEREANPPANPEPARGEFRNPFEAWVLEEEQEPRGTVRLALRRGDERLTLSMPSGNWSPFYRVLPELEPSLAEAWAKGVAALEANDLEAGGKQLRAVAKTLAAAGRHDLAAWVIARIAAGVPEDRSSDARAIMDEALIEAGETADPFASVELLYRKLWAHTSIELENALSESILGEALRFAEKVPDSLLPAKLLMSLGMVAARRGDLATAESRTKRALAMRERWAPGTHKVSAALSNLGVFLTDRGKFAEAEAALERALEIDELIAPDGEQFGLELVNVGSLAYARGDLAAAERVTRRALAIFEKHSPEGLGMVHATGNLGQYLRDRGDLAGAEAFQRRSVELIDKLPEAETDRAISHAALGQLYFDRGNLPAARVEYERSRQIMSKINIETTEGGAALLGLGRVAMAERDLGRAEPLLADAVRILARAAPGTDDEAEARYEHAQAALRAGRLAEGARRMLAALDALDAYRSGVARTEQAREHFGRRFTRYYRETAELLLSLNRKSEAFAVLERSRARFLLEMLAERDLELERELPADVAAERLALDAEFDRVQSELSDPEAAKDAARRASLTARLGEIRATRERLATRIRDLSPRLAAVRYPRPLGVDQARAALDPGETLLAYDVGSEKTVLYVLESGAGKGAAALHVYTLPVAEKQLRESVATWRGLVRSTDAGSRAELALRSRALYDLLVKPAEAEVGRAERIVIVPDGPLHLLPFAALRRARAGGDGEQYLVEWKPLHRVVSMTVYAELKRARAKAAPPREPLLAAFGDPRYPESVTGAKPRTRGEGDAPVAVATDPVLNEVVERGVKLVPLPATRREVEAVAALYGPSARTFLGAEASEEHAKELGREPKLVHFACHALVNERFPLDSALALSIPDPPRPGADNGLLQAWEVFESVHLDADLVTLSACDSGLGGETSGEGLVGLTRAFQYAGARSVLPSWWRVEDSATAALMERFYARLKDGAAKDEALRSAQIDFIRGGAGAEERASPVHWAAWEIVGDWR